MEWDEVLITASECSAIDLKEGENPERMSQREACRWCYSVSENLHGIDLSVHGANLGYCRASGELIRLEITLDHLGNGGVGSFFVSLLLKLCLGGKRWWNQMLKLRLVLLPSSLTIRYLAPSSDD